MNVDRLLDNHSATIATCAQLTDRHGREVVVAIAKLSFAVSTTGQVRLAVPPATIRWSDEWYPGLVGVRYPSDIAEEKPGTDVVLAGTAQRPADKAATFADVGFRVGRLARALRVHGPRVWYRGALGVLSPGPAGPFVPAPLAYDLTFGASEPVEGAQAPRIEDPQHPGRPSGVGALPPSAEARQRHAGTYDESWARERAPVLPSDFDPRFYSCAAPELWSAAPLLGDEAVEVTGATPEGRWMFRLPRYAPRFFSDLRGEIREHETHLDTFLVDADERRAELTWRVKVELPRKTEMLRRISIVEAAPLPDELYAQALQDIEIDLSRAEEARS